MSLISFDAGSLVHIAALFQIVGFLVVDQLILRGLILVGTVFYLTYYVVAFDNPLWEAFFWSSIMGIANSIVIVKLLLDRTTFNLSAEDKKLYEVFWEMTPGEFRQLVKTGTWHSGDEDRFLTVEGEVPQSLYYVQVGAIHIEKQGNKFDLSKSSFIGEVAFFLNCEASATVTVSEDTRYIEWDCGKLRALLQKNPGIRAALDSKLNQDMAKKVAKSIRAEAFA